jgi:prevent-host-death family protein
LKRWRGGVCLTGSLERSCADRKNDQDNGKRKQSRCKHAESITAQAALSGQFGNLTNLTNYGDDGSVVGMTLNLYEAKTQLSALVDQAAAGAEIIIAKNGKPMAKLVAIRTLRKPGRLKGKIWMSDDFDAPMPDIDDAFENSVIE